MAVRTIVVAGSGDASDIDTYLYAHTGRAITVQGARRFVAFCTTSTEDGGLAGDSDDQAAYLAIYQAGRLESGLYFARVFDTISDACVDPDVAYLLNEANPEFAARIIAAAKALAQ